jgi:hypothetical protein
MSPTIIDSPNSEPAMSVPPGWLIVAPGGHPYAWYSHDWPDVHDEASAFARFVPNTAVRTRMLAAGWMARADGYAHLFASASGQSKASA